MGAFSIPRAEYLKRLHAVRDQTVDLRELDLQTG
jgi:hypothetical protein